MPHIDSFSIVSSSKMKCMGDFWYAYTSLVANSKRKKNQQQQKNSGSNTHSYVLDIIQCISQILCYNQNENSIKSERSHQSGQDKDKKAESYKSENDVSNAIETIACAISGKKDIQTAAMLLAQVKCKGDTAQQMALMDPKRAKR